MRATGCIATNVSDESSGAKPHFEFFGSLRVASRLQALAQVRPARLIDEQAKAGQWIDSKRYWTRNDSQDYLTKYDASNREFRDAYGSNSYAVWKAFEKQITERCKAEWKSNRDAFRNPRWLVVMADRAAAEWLAAE